ASYRQRRTKCSATVAENWLFPRHIKHSAISSSVCPRRREVNCEIACQSHGLAACRSFGRPKFVGFMVIGSFVDEPTSCAVHPAFHRSDGTAANARRVLIRKSFRGYQ